MAEDNDNPVSLEIEGINGVRQVTDIKYKFTQATDIEGQLAGVPRGGKVVITTKAWNDGNSDLLAWMLAPNTAHNFTVTFISTVDGKVMKTIKGTNCYCVHYKEVWEEGKGDLEELTIVCQEFENGAATFKNKWQ